MYRWQLNKFYGETSVNTLNVATRLLKFHDSLILFYKIHFEEEDVFKSVQHI